ncbi:MAG TPA: DMT family transporter [Rectinemataceae bacterium]
MNKLGQKLQSRLPSADFGSWIVLGLISHSAWGGYPVLARYLQKIHHLGTMSMAAMTNTLAAILIVAFMGKKIDLKTITLKQALILAFLVISRGLTNLYASRFTYATTVQLFSLLAPFIVALLSFKLYREPLPRHTIVALVVSLAGSIAMIYGATPSRASNLGGNDHPLGIALAAVSGALLAFYMIFIKNRGKTGSSAETMAFIQFASLALFMCCGSVIAKEEWNPWLVIAPSGILAYTAFALGVLLFGTVMQNKALKHLGAPMYSTLQAWRLLSTIIYSWVILGERIETLWQAIGTITVVATITLYTVSQNALWRRAASGGDDGNRVRKNPTGRS